MVERIASPATPVTKMSAVQPGTVIAFDIDGTTHIGISTIPPREGASPSVVVLVPGHPQLPGRTGLLEAVAINGPVVAFPEAKVRPAVSTEHIHCSSDSPRPQNGALFMMPGEEGDDLVIATSGGKYRPYAFSVLSGELVPLSDLHRLVWFSSWEIGHHALDGQWLQLCQVRSLPDID